MEFGERKTKPESNRKFLLQQVAEQSEFCDVTVKMGLWEKRFHKCVLAASPFFHGMLKNDFIEKQTGELEVTLGSPATLEMAVMFLYGKKPKLTHQNVEHVMEFAEFLLIPNLKAACVSWMKTFNITEDNCMDLLELASIYEFDMPKCIVYIQAHMSEMLQHVQMINLTNDSVEYLLSDIKLSYVAMEEKLRFLVRWMKANPEHRTESAVEFSKFIDFEDVSPSLLEELKQDATICKLIDFGCIKESTGANTDLHSVLLMKDINSWSITCFDVNRERWYRLNSATLEERCYSYSDIAGVRSGNSEIYFTKNNRSEYTVLTLNLETDDSRSQTILLNDNDASTRLNKISMNADICVGCVNMLTERNKSMDTTRLSAMDFTSRMRTMSLPRDDPKCQMMEFRCLTGPNRKYYTNISVLYMAHISVAPDIELLPILTLLDEDIQQLCVNEKSTVAMVSGSRTHIILFDLLEYKMEKIKLKTYTVDKLVATDGGFLLHNNKRCAYITEIMAPNRSKRHLVGEAELENNRNWDITYQFCANTWYRYFQRDYSNGFKFECARHVDVTIASCPDGVIWRRLPLPKEDSQCNRNTITDSFVQIRLSKGKFRCNLECPHCKIPEATTRELLTYCVAAGDSDAYYNDSSDAYYNDSSDAYYDDSSDEDNYGGSFYDD